MSTIYAVRFRILKTPTVPQPPPIEPQIALLLAKGAKQATDIVSTLPSVDPESIEVRDLYDHTIVVIKQGYVRDWRSFTPATEGLSGEEPKPSSGLD
ncbi:MAG: hypothetical protein WB607_06110 [Candidatus Acidiferrum sp.]